MSSKSSSRRIKIAQAQLVERAHLEMRVGAADELELAALFGEGG